MDITRYLLDHYVMLTELIGLWAMLSLGVHLQKETTKATRITILLIVLESVVWSLERWTQNNPGNELLRAMLTSGVYCLHPIIVVGIICMVAPLKKHRNLLVAPLLVYVPLVFTSQWTHVIFYIREDNCWEGNGDILCYLPYAVFFAYAIIFVILFINRYKNNNRKTLTGVIYIVIVGIAGVFLNLFKDGVTDYSTLFSSVIVLYYLFMYLYTSKTDSLTGMQNRQSFYHDTAGGNNRYSAVCSADMNELKWINDSRGHVAGDIAIKTVAECIMINSGNRKTAYRVGGDEFVIVYRDMNEEEVRLDIELMREGLSKAGYVCAFGYSVIGGDTDFNTALQIADKEMYEDKSNIKKAVLAAGGKLHRRAGD